MRIFETFSGWTATIEKINDIFVINGIEYIIKKQSTSAGGLYTILEKVNDKKSILVFQKQHNPILYNKYDF